MKDSKCSDRFIPYGCQSIDESDCSAVLRVLKSDSLTGGIEVEKFEEEFADFVGAKHAVAVNNGTAALHLAMRVAEIGPADRVITSPNTFLASANCATYVGAHPDFADIDPQTYTLCPKSFKEGIKEDCRAVIPVAYGGQSADMPAIAEIARENDMIVIEDACHGPGTAFSHEGRRWKTGGHPWADMTTYSFHPVKSLTTGEGGMLVTNNDTYAKHARLLRNHGMQRNESSFKVFGASKDALEEAGPWTYEMQDLGYNYRLTDIQCALGRSQLAKLPGFIERRRKIVAHYNKAFSDLEWLTRPRLRCEADRDLISWHLYTVLIDIPHLGTSRSDIMNYLRSVGIGSQVLYIPVYLQPWYRDRYGYKPGKCPVAEDYYRKCLSLPLYPDLTETDLDRVTEAVVKIPEVL